MTLSASFVWKNADASRDLNARLRRIVLRGVVFGGDVSPGLGLNIVVDPSIAVSYDGMTVVEDQQQTLPVVAGTNRYICLWAKYNDGGMPATPTLQWVVLEAAVYNAHAEKDYMIVYARVQIPGAAVNVLPDYIYYDVRDTVDPLGRDWFRGRVATSAALPTPPPHMNVVGDFYYVVADNTFYFWSGAAWEPLSTGSYNLETSFMNKYLADKEQARFVEGSGVIGGMRPHPDANFASDPEIPIIATPLTANQIAVDAFTAYVNGHRIQVHAQTIALPAKPAGPGDRYDIVYLEVWREAIVVPETFVYGRNPTGALTYTLPQAEDVAESLTWVGGLAGDNFNLNPIEPHNHNWRVVRWRIGTAQGIASTALHNPSDPVISGACQNIDGILAFTSQPAGTGTDDRLWISPAAATSDGFTWAIPLLVLRRTPSEVPGDEVQIFRDGIRYVFPVYPVADTSQAMRLALDTQYRQEPTPFTLDHYPYDEPSGFLSGMDHQIETDVTPNSIKVYEDQIHIRIRGIEDWISLPGGSEIALPAAPITTGANAWARHLVYLKMNVTLYADGPGASTVNQFVSQRHHPYIPSDIGGDVRGQGWKRGYVTFEYVATNLGNNDYLDEHDAMTAAGWTRGDLTMATKNAQYEDGGVWSKAIAIDADDRVHPYETEWAVPVCLIHRRNTQAWHYNTNANGSGAGRPDGRTNANIIYPDDLLDLRHEVGVDVADLERRLYSDFDKNMKGQLRTRMANKYRGAGTGGTVAGTRIMQSDSIGGLAGTFQLTAADGVRGIWSDAKEFFPVSVSFDLLASSSGDLYDYSYDAMANEGTLKIRAPGFSAGPPATAYAAIVRHIPAAVYVKAAGGANQMDYLGPPCWTTQSNLFGVPAPPGVPYPCTAKYVDTSGVASSSPIEGIITFAYYPDPTTGYEGQSFAVTETNAVGKAIEMEAIIDTSGLPLSADAVLSFWVHYDRSFAGEHSVNYGLAEVPDTVWKAIKDPNGTPEELNLGPIYTVVRKTITATNTVTITDADVSAASGIPGTVTLCWADVYSIRYNGAIVSTVSAMTMADTRDSITVTYAAPITTEADFLVFFYTDERNKWIEVGRGGKSVQAVLNWEESPGGEVDLGATYTGYSWDLGNKTWRSPNVVGRQIWAPFVWHRATSGAGDWIAHFSTTTLITGYENSNLVTIVTTPLDRYLLVIVPTLSPLTNAASDNLLLHYTYTPYQGLSSVGGEPATVATALPKLKTMLHGDIEANTDLFITQSGLCSYYSGVDAWSGNSPNFSLISKTSTAGAVKGLFEEYVSTALVKSHNNGGTQENVPEIGHKQQLNAASICRLPFPTNNNMFTSDYHVGCMDFDLDPGRVGAGSGYRLYAPSYDPLLVGTIVYHQFVNSLTNLQVQGEAFNTNQSSMIATSDYAATPTNEAQYDEDSTWVTAHPAHKAYVDFCIPTKSWDLVKRIRVRADLTNFMQSTAPTTKCAFIYDNGTHDTNFFLDLAAAVWDRTNYGSSYIDIRDVGGTGVASTTFFLLYPGVIMERLLSRSTRINVLVQLRNDSPSTAATKIYHTDTIIESSDVLYREQSGQAGKTVDLIIMAFGSFSSKQSVSTVFSIQKHRVTNSITSLTGLTVQYPDDWSIATTAVIDALYQASEDHLGHGRGLYVGSTTRRYNAPVLVPGSGTFLDEILGDLSQHIDYASSAPQPLPYMPAEPMFASSHQQYFPNDHGGPLAYCGFGAAMRPSSDDYKNQVVMQISGGPTGGTYFGKFTPNDLAGTAIDAFWPTGRPVLKSRK